MVSDSDLTDGNLEELLKGLNEQEDKQLTNDSRPVVSHRS